MLAVLTMFAGLFAPFAITQSATAQQAISISYPDFSSVAGLTLSGSAQQVGNVMQLTPSLGGQTGSAFSNTTVDTSQSFSTRFQFWLHDAPSTPADGVAFVLQQSAPSGNAAYLGTPPSIAVEFDIFHNSWLGDPDDNHVGIVQNGDPAAHLKTATPSHRLYGAPVYVWIDYNATAKNLTISTALTETKPGSVLLSFPVDLATTVSPVAYVGFTGTTGASSATQDILSWQFAYGAPETPTIMAGDFNGIIPLDDPAPKGTTGNKGTCTAGFAVIKNATRYMLTANHCRAFTKDEGATITGYSDFVRVVSAADVAKRTTYSQRINCTGAVTDECLTSLISKSDDILAWRPDPGAGLPTGLLRTDHGIYPVLGTKVWRSGQKVCRFGQKTLEETGKGEKCGTIRAFDKRLNRVSMVDDYGRNAVGGDSGGPVYAYEYAPDGTRVGVWAIGITTDAVEVSKRFKTEYLTYFLPIDTVKSVLGVEVLAGSSVGTPSP